MLELQLFMFIQQQKTFISNHIFQCKNTLRGQGVSWDQVMENEF